MQTVDDSQKASGNYNYVLTNHKGPNSLGRMGKKKGILSLYCISG